MSDYKPDSARRDIAMLHRIFWHQQWEYETTFVEGFGDWPGRDTPPDGEGWERNVEAGDNGYERRTRIQCSYWRRRKQH